MIIMIIFFGILFSMCIGYTIYYIVSIIYNCINIYNTETVPLINNV
jgi:hypothetical protein